MWQDVKLSEQIRPRDTLACCWDVKQPTNNNSLHFPVHFSRDQDEIWSSWDGTTLVPNGLMVQPIGYSWNECHLNSVILNSWAVLRTTWHATRHIARDKRLMCLRMFCTRLRPGHLSVRVGGSSRRNKEIVKISNRACECDYYYYFFWVRLTGSRERTDIALAASNDFYSGLYSNVRGPICFRIALMIDATELCILILV